MFVNDNLKIATLPIGNLATGGNIGTAAATVDIASSFEVTQTTAGQAVTLPNPTDGLAGDLVRVANAPASTASFTMYGVKVPAGQYAEFFWDGSAWLYQEGGRNSGASVLVAAIAVGNNTITHNLNMPAGSFSQVVFRAYNALGNEVVFRRVKASDTANAIVVNSTVALANITFDIVPLA